MHDLAQQHGQDAIEQQNATVAATDDPSDAIGELRAESGFVETRGNHAHCPNHDNDLVGKVGKDLLRGEAARERKHCDGGHRDRGDAPHICHVARAGQNENDQADDEMIGHCLFLS